MLHILVGMVLLVVTSLAICLVVVGIIFVFVEVSRLSWSLFENIVIHRGQIRCPCDTYTLHQYFERGCAVCPQCSYRGKHDFSCGYCIKGSGWTTLTLLAQLREELYGDRQGLSA